MSRLLNKGNKLYSIIYNYCPRCHTGKFWPESNPYKNLFVINGGNIGCCKNCNLKYEIEPGFWYGAMYVSYGITVSISILAWFIVNALNKDLNFSILISIISLVLIILSPVVYFLSRLIWINICVSYDKTL